MAAETEKKSESSSSTKASNKWLKDAYKNTTSGLKRVGLTAASTATEFMGLVGTSMFLPTVFVNPINLLMFGVAPLAASATIAWESGLKEKSTREKTNSVFWRGANLAMAAVPGWNSLIATPIGKATTNVIGLAMSSVSTFLATRKSK